ncbi:MULTISPECIES: response regulator transcription factor [unclassified Niallia]|uniref:response regulator transcription factor n=1 Tax=unclassified Niallia TaxID=2837522 RepID=UPI001EDA0E51|nr:MULTISPECIES: response regulator transcription factor [unclassified Niallia]MDL0435862.1 response regulator transcription factor [Niallia sp. SS-2023]UPO86205.1 response regulator transcription factor [Niallia sp. Man26]
MALERGRLLIVDDEILIRQGIKHYVNWEQEGFEIVGEAAHGQEALDLIEVVKPDFIITDIVMPIMDGEELTRIVKEKYPHIEVVVLSSFGDFDYVRSTFQNGVLDYILKPKLDAESLLAVLRKMKKRLPARKIDEEEALNTFVANAVRKMLSGYEVEHSLKLTDRFLHRKYCLVSVEQRDGTGELSSAVKTWINSGLSEQGYICFITDNILLINGDNFKALHSFLENTVAIKYNLQLIVSGEFEDFMQIGKIYKEEILKLIKCSFYFPDIPVLTVQHLHITVTDLEKFHLDWFINEFKCKRFDSAFAYLEDHVAAISSMYTLDVYEYKSFFSNIIFNITILLSNMEYEIHSLEQSKYVYLKGIEEANSAEEVVKKLECFLRDTKTVINTVKTKPENVNIKNIIAYMNEHYREPLTLTNVAQHFHFNPSYLSSYFSTHMKEGFSEYLNRVRIEEASKLLVAGTAPISEISGIVGYSDHSYFCKVFKKMTGLSPSQFRRRQWVEKS